jgi:mono/diheme cytochrome c family protein
MPRLLSLVSPLAWFSLVALVGGSLLGQPQSAQAGDLVFNRDIRPLLSDACFQCHGPDDQQRHGGLRLDQVDWSRLAGDSGAKVVVAGKRAESELWERITTSDPALKMPPPKSGKSLSPAQIETLGRWIEQGASTAGHWAFQAPVRSPVPALTRPARVINPIDQFILARVHAAGLEQNPEADRATLLRRVTLDLTGLPPTPAEVDAFLTDHADGAYERVVDRLLSSPRYGEQMAQAWLDLARYADSNGFQVDSSRQMWPWRDWVIDAFNRNLPFDQFTIEQLAGDLLPESTLPQRVATGFNRNHRLNGEGGLIAEEWRVETVIDRVETTGLTWLGLTLNCCRCHDHKYDPISQAEFYRFFSYFNNVPESGTLGGESRNTDPVEPVPTPAQLNRQQELGQLVTAAAERARVAAEQLPALVEQWEPQFQELAAKSSTGWVALEPTAARSTGGATLTRQPDGSWLVGGPNPSHDTYELEATLPGGAFGGLLVECFPDASLPNQSVGRAFNGNFVLSRVEVELRPPEQEPLRPEFQKAVADYSQPGWEIAHTLGKDRGKGWAADGPTRKQPLKAMFLTATPVAAPAGTRLVVRLHHESIAQHNIGKFRLSTTALPADSVNLEGSRFPATLLAVAKIPPAERNADQRAELLAWFRANIDNPVRKADDETAKLKQELADLPKSFANVMVMKEGAVREARVLIRGQYDRPGDVVTAGLPAVLPPLPEGSPNNRLGLARWMTHRQHPLTARVWVNRAWERFFGTGLVKTSENLGSQAEFPSHPELLDWLAVEFMQPEVMAPVAGVPAHAWDMKGLHRLLVTSATYRQSARVAPQGLEIDPDNRLLSRGPRFRLSAEMVRDQALAAAGLLVDKIGGPSVRPYMPDGVWDDTSRYGDLLRYQHEAGPGLYRRSLYTIWKRTAAPPSMLLFDAPNREVCTPRRSRTNTPLQALALLNEVTYVEAARQLAERMQAEAGPRLEDRLNHGVKLVLGRAARPEELQILVEGFTADLARFQAQPELADKLLQVGETPRPANRPTPEAAAWTLTANTLLNLDEATTRE